METSSKLEVKHTVDGIWFIWSFQNDIGGLSILLVQESCACNSWTRIFCCMKCYQFVDSPKPIQYNFCLLCYDWQIWTWIFTHILISDCCNSSPLGIMNNNNENLCVFQARKIHDVYAFWTVFFYNKTHKV